MAVPLLCACITLTTEPRAVVSGPAGTADVVALRCDDAVRAMQDARARNAAGALDGQAFRTLVWNIHKEADVGWDRDLAQFAAASDVVLLQETALTLPLRNALEGAGLRWVLASSFMYDADDIGVLTATRIAPLASCTQRAVEPLLRIPKSAVITWLRIAGIEETVAIVNVHAINFEIFLQAYRAQLEAIADALASHRGPIILAGDFNTWSDSREQVVAEIAARLGLKELVLPVDQRATFLGRHVDHIFVRGLELADVVAIPVTSSDHNPVMATLRIPSHVTDD